MFNINYNDIKKSKKEYSSFLKNHDINSYRLHEKINTSLNRSIQTNFTDSTASKSNSNKTFQSTYTKSPVRTKKIYPIKKCSYLDFLELRNTKDSVPFCNLEKRFKWQNLKDENIVVYPEIYKRPHKKQHLLKETFGEGILEHFNNKEQYDQIPKIKRLRRSNSEQSRNMKNSIQKIDIDISRRVINPEYNKEPEKICKKKSNSLSKFILHKTNGNIKSMFELTPVEIPIKGKKLFKTKSYGALSINLFDNNYGKYEMPTHTKKLFLDNKCFYDHIKDESLITKMDDCWKVKRSRSVVNPEFRTGIEFTCYRNIDNLNLRNYNKNNSHKKENTRSLSKIRRPMKTNKK